MIKKEDKWLIFWFGPYGGLVLLVNTIVLGLTGIGLALAEKSWWPLIVSAALPFFIVYLFFRSRKIDPEDFKEEMRWYDDVR